MKKKRKLSKLYLILGTTLILGYFFSGDSLRVKIFINEILFPKEVISKKFLFKSSMNSSNAIKTEYDNKEVKVEIIHKKYKKNILDLSKEIHDCEEEFNAIFEPFLKGETPIEVDNARAILVLEDLESFDFRNSFYKKEYKRDANVSPCSNQSSIVLLNQVLSENALDSWENDTIQKMRKVLTQLLIEMSKLPGSIEDFENIFVQLELIHEKNLFEGIYSEELKKLRVEFENVKGVYELRDFAYKGEAHKDLKKTRSSEDALKKFKQKVSKFLNTTLMDFYVP